LVFQNKAAARFINKTFVPFKIVRNEGEYKQLREFFQMRGFPTIVVLAPDGLERDRMIGFDGDGAKFLATIEDWAADKNTLVTYLNHWAKDTSDVEWNYRIAERYVERGQLELSQSFFDRVVRLDVGDVNGYLPEAHFQLAVHQLRNLSNPTPLNGLLAAETDQGRLKSGYSILTSYYEDQKDTAKTIEAYREGLQKLPDSINLMNGCAWFIHLNALKELYPWGIELGERAVALTPGEDSIWDTLAWIYYDAGQLDKAVAAAQKALSLAPKSEYHIETLQKMKSDLQSKTSS
jgi:tetratricopeptide (TPR) repeat protein